MTRSDCAPGAAIHSALTPPASTGSHLTSGATRSLTFSIPARRRSMLAFGLRGCDVIISMTFFSCSLAMVRASSAYPYHLYEKAEQLS